jgi:hypothetical protein
MRHYFGPDVLNVPAPYEGGRCIKEMERLRELSERIWLVVPPTRKEVPEEVTQWLWKNAVLAKRYRALRLDYSDYVVDVYVLGRMNRPAPEELRPAGNSEAAENVAGLNRAAGKGGSVPNRQLKR